MYGGYSEDWGGQGCPDTGIVRNGVTFACRSGSPVRGDSTWCRFRADSARGEQKARYWGYVTVEGDSTVPPPNSFDSTAWSGRLVLAGTMTAITERDTFRMAMRVRKRDWLSARASETIERFSNSSPADRVFLPARPSAFDSQFGMTLPRLVAAAGPTQIDHGPNAGLYFYDSIPFSLNFHIVINDSATTAGGAFWQMQSSAIRTGRQNGVSRVFCSRAVVESLRDLVEEHEGTARQRYSHVEIFAESLATQMNRIVERAVFTIEDRRRYFRDSLLHTLTDSAHKYSSKVDSGAYPSSLTLMSPRFPCQTFVYQP